jgi:hypothetical protein
VPLSIRVAGLDDMERAVKLLRRQGFDVTYGFFLPGKSL